MQILIRAGMRHTYNRGPKEPLNTTISFGILESRMEPFNGTIINNNGYRKYYVQ
jgi:hypothetical protein